MVQVFKDYKVRKRSNVTCKRDVRKRQRKKECSNTGEMRENVIFKCDGTHRRWENKKRRESLAFGNVFYWCVMLDTPLTR